MSARTSSTSGQQSGPAKPKRVRGARERRQDAQWRQRKKQERQELQEAVQALQTKLAQLQQANGLHMEARECETMDQDAAMSCNRVRPGTAVPTLLPTKRKSEWQREAAAKRQERVQAERVNETLKRAVASQRGTIKSLRSLFEKRPALPRSVIDKLGSPAYSHVRSAPQHSQCAQCCDPTTLHINPTAVKRELEATLQRMRVAVNDAADTLAKTPGLSCSYDMQLHSVVGPTIEVQTTTPLSCGLDRAIQLLGTKVHAIARSAFHGARCTPELELDGDDVRDQQFTLELGAPYQTIILNGFRSTSNSMDSNRFAMSWVAISFDRCGALCFRECASLAVVRSSANLEHESVIRAHYTVAVEKAMGCTVVDGEHIDRVRDRALRSMGQQVRGKYTAMQRELLRKNGQEDLIAFVGQ